MSRNDERLTDDFTLKNYVDNLSSDLWPPVELGDPDWNTWFRNFDWASTSLGPTATWPHQLKKACELMLVNPDPVTVFWGPDLILIYNEPYVALAGNKHPAMMGGSARIHWAEVWDQYDPLFDQMRIDKKALKQTNTQLFIERNGYLEEGFFTLCVMPLLGDDGEVIGYYEPVTEVTKQTLAERRMHTLLNLSQGIASATSVKDVWRLALDTLGGHASIRYLGLYSLDGDASSRGHRHYVLEGTDRLGPDTTGIRQRLDLDDPTTEGIIPALRKCSESGQPFVLSADDGTLSPSLLKRIGTSGVKQTLRTCITYPLRSSGEELVEAFLIIGVDPKRPYDQEYRVFIDLVARQVEGAITSVKLFERERERLRQRAAQESELKFKRFAENVQVGIYNFDSAGNLIFCNDAWVQLTGHDRSNQSAMSWANDVHPDCIADAHAYWDKMNNMEGPQTFEVQYKKPWKRMQGSTAISLDRTYALASAYPEVNEKGELFGIIGCVTDISGLKWLDRLQSQRLEEALELKRQQENFLDITSHEMRNPLNAILHCATELTELLPDLASNTLVGERAETLKECLDASRTIVYCGRHQKRIIDDVLTLSKLDSNLMSISPVETRPLEVVEEVLKVFDTEIRASSIKAKTELADSYRTLNIETILVDSHRLIQILINLVANAIKFTKGESLRSLHVVVGALTVEPEGSEAGVRYVPSGRHRADPTLQAEWGPGETLFLHFSVRDTGPGMSPEEANALFNRFAQASPRTHVQYGGTGLGLFISRELAELHGGRIGISSEKGQGSTFDFYVKGRRPATPNPLALPILQKPDMTDILLPTSVSPRTSPSSVTKTVTGGKRQDPSFRILIVEDNLINQKILAKLLRKQGYDVSAANHGQEALSIIHESTWRRRPPDQRLSTQRLAIDLVLADIEMPVMDGKEFVRHVRLQQKEGVLSEGIPIIAVTGNARNEQVQEAHRCGFDQVVRKPYQVDDIVSIIRRYTEGVSP